MVLDLAELRTMHPRLPAEVAAILVARGALALVREGHESPKDLHTDVEDQVHSAVLGWPAVDSGDLSQHPPNQVTEYGAEAVALAVVSQVQGWSVVCRMDEEHADWLLEKGEETLGLEVSGVARGPLDSRLAEKLVQVSRARGVDRRSACVVGFEQPRAVLRSLEG